MSEHNVSSGIVLSCAMSLSIGLGCATDTVACPDGTEIPDFNEGGRTCVPAGDGGPPDGPPDGPPNPPPECTSDVECPDPDAPRCEPTTGTCEGCTEDVHCVGIASLARCDGTEGSCVECQPATEELDCGETSCDPANLSCTDIVRGSREICEPCLSDSDCMDELFCVPMLYLNTPRAGGYCLKEFAPGGCEQPFVIELEDRTTLSAVTKQSYCGINENLATCEAVNGLLDNLGCPSGQDEECPQPSGLCRDVGGAASRCTYECGNPIQCLDPTTSPSQSSCGNGDTSGEPDYCGG